MLRSVGLFWFLLRIGDSFRWKNRSTIKEIRTRWGIWRSRFCRWASVRGGRCYVSACIFFVCCTEATFKKKIQARDGQCGRKQQGERGKGKGDKGKGKGEKDKGKHKKNKAANLLPYWVWGVIWIVPRMMYLLAFLLFLSQRRDSFRWKNRSTIKEIRTRWGTLVDYFCFGRYSRIFLSSTSSISCWTCLQRSRPAMPPPRSVKKEWRELLRYCIICSTSRE